MESIEKLREYYEQNVIHPHEYLVMLDEIEREIAERYMELPVDADDEPIRCGDVVDGGMGDSGEVQHIEIWPDGFVVVYEISPGRFTRYAPDAVRHVKPDPVKELLEEYYSKRSDDALDESACSGLHREEAIKCVRRDVAALIDEYAARIREAVEK